MPMIEANPIEGLNVYGIKQMDYTVDGVAGKSYSHALAAAAIRHSKAIEFEAAAYSDLVNVRIKKVDDLGKVLAKLAEAVASMKTKDPTSSDWAEGVSGLKEIRDIAAKYGINIPLSDDGNIQREAAYNAQNDVQYELDTEDNSLQQDMVNLQSLISKRDNAYSTASKIIQKVDSTGDTLVGGIGG